MPPAYDASSASLTAHTDAIGKMMAGHARLWLGPFDPVPQLPSGFEETVLVVPTSGSTGDAKAVALSRTALLASQDATAQLLAEDPALAATGGHGFWLPLLPPTHIAGVQVIARAHRTAQVLGLSSPALPGRLPDLRGHFDSAAFVALAEPALEQAEAAGLPALTSLVPTQLSRIVTGATGADARARAVLRRFAAVLVGGAATRGEVLARARGQRVAVRTTYGSSETAGGCVYDRHALPGVRLRLEAPDHEGAGRLVVHSPTLATGYLTPDGHSDTTPFARPDPTSADSVSSPDGPESFSTDRGSTSAGRGSISADRGSISADRARRGHSTSSRPEPGPSSTPGIGGGHPSPRAGAEASLRAFTTSDLATLSSDGSLTVLGRADDVINTGGRKVLPQDVERLVDRSLMLRGMVRSCVVVGVEDHDWGQRVEALVTLDPGVDPEEAPALVRAALRTSETPSHQIPKRVHVVDELPLLGIGKIDRAAARDLAAARSTP